MIPLSAWDGEWITPGYTTRTFDIKRVGATVELTPCDPWPRVAREAVKHAARETQRHISRAAMTRVGNLDLSFRIEVWGRAVDALAGMTDGQDVPSTHSPVVLYGRWPE